MKKRILCVLFCLAIVLSGTVSLAADEPGVHEAEAALPGFSEETPDSAKTHEHVGYGPYLCMECDVFPFWDNYDSYKEIENGHEHPGDQKIVCLICILDLPIFDCSGIGEKQCREEEEGPCNPGPCDLYWFITSTHCVQQCAKCLYQVSSPTPHIFVMMNGSLTCVKCAYKYN